MSRKIFAEKDNYNCIVYMYMSIKLVLRYFKLFILFLLTFFQHLHVELYTPTPIKNNYMYHTWKLTATIWHFCQKNLY